MRNFHLTLSYVVPVKSKVEISQNFVAFSEYMNFIKKGDKYFELSLGISANSLPNLIMDAAHSSCSQFIMHEFLGHPMVSFFKK